ncbi:hypothetical protein [Algoriphagus sp. A40]|uniref:hypothetical protein n=1 Tax=Algoriphagus sp. A40 TaxID=1945863 RepID=UPI0009848F23|nr:hypothetical protein [Algoriphagus sp. A40]OOG70714.1 hypothetical protein B0E43_19225 [Algoriphagus sp. A40]
MKKLSLVILVWIVFITNSSSQSQEKLLYVLGTSGAGIVYNTFQYLDLLHEGLVVECNSAEMVANAAAAQVGFLEVVEKSYLELKDSEDLSDPSDQLYIQRLAELITLLKEQAIHLNSISTNGDEESKDAYAKTKEAAWVRISDLLQLDSQKP